MQDTLAENWMKLGLELSPHFVHGLKSWQKGSVARIYKNTWVEYKVVFKKEGQELQNWA